MSGDKQKVCRDCVHGKWQYGPTGRIARGSLGRCTIAGKLLWDATAALKSDSPAVLVRISPIQPTSKAAKCLGFEIKQPKAEQP
jgi:hypothetical protein